MNKKMKPAKELVYQSTLPANSLLQNFNAARKAGLFCDANLVSQERSFPVHRVIVSVSSQCFKDLFEKSEEYDLECADIEADDLELILDYLYTSEIKIPHSQVRSVLRASKTCGLSDLAGACMSYLEENIFTEDSFELRHFAMQETNWSLCSKVDAYLRDNFSHLYQSKEFLLLPRLQVTLIASRHCSNQDLEHPTFLFEKVIAWVKKRQQEHGEKLSSLLEESNMLYLQSNHLLKDCALEEIEEHVDVNSNEDIKKFRRQTSRHRPEMVGSELISPGLKRRDLSLSDEYKLIADVHSSEQNSVGLTVLGGQLIAVALHYKSRHSSSNGSTVSSDSSGCEDNGLNISMTMLAPMAIGRCSAGIALCDKKLFMIGGYNRGQCLTSCEYYDADINEWTDLPSLDTQRARLQSVTFGHQIFVTGGSDGHDDLASTEIYDTVSQQWLPGEGMIDRRASFGMDIIQDKIFAVGGVSDSKSLRTVECYDVASKTWSRLPPMKTPRENVCAVAYHGNIYAIGGRDGWKCHCSVEMLDPETGIWTDAPNMSVCRRGAASAVSDGKIILAGGSDGKTALNSVESYDDETNCWTQLPGMTSCRNNASMVVIDSVPYVIGGFGGYSGTEFLNTVEYLDPVTNEWKVYIHG